MAQRILQNSDDMTQEQAEQLSTTGIVREVSNGEDGICWIEFDTVTDAETWDRQR